MASSFLIKFNTGISVHRVDFSDPQGGKGACDRKAATIKAHERRYVNEGHDVQNAQEFKTAMLSNGGVIRVRVAVVDVAIPTWGPPQVKLDGVSMLNNFEFSSEVVTVWRAFDAGQGKQISKSKLHGKKKKT